MYRVIFIYKGERMGCILNNKPLERILTKQNIKIEDIQVIEYEKLSLLEAYSHLNSLKNTKEYKYMEILNGFFNNYKED